MLFLFIDTLCNWKGPGLIALSLIMCAFCLRAWRRNGIACDELIFLPGSAHAGKAEQKDGNFRLPLNLRHGELSATQCDSTNICLASSLDEEEDLGDFFESSIELGPLSPLRNDSGHSMDRSSSPVLAPAESLESDEAEMVPLTLAEEEVLAPTSLWSSCRKTKSAKNTNADSNTNTASSTGSSSLSRELPKYQEQQQKFKGFLKLFSTLSRETNAYAPSGPIVASAGLDLCMPVLLNFHMFMLLTHTDGSEEVTIPPQVLPLIFLSILMVRSFIPFGARKRFWGTIHSAASAPFYNVTFRDLLIGEVATSMVRPLQDICFALFYYVASFYAIFSGNPDLERTGSKLEYNFILHNIVLPTCAVLPLLSRFLQTLRQAYGEQRRWPHLGNAFKYFSAAMVIFYGMTHSEEERSGLWIYCFGICLIYQIWWDIVIDWEVLRILPKDEVDPCCFPFSFLRRIQLRSTRLFKSNRTYWRIIAFNTLFRFTWMLSFIPAYHFNMTGEKKDTFSMDVSSIVGVALSLAELLRRCYWVLLRLELETIKMKDTKYLGNKCAKASSRVQYRCCAPNEYVSVRCDVTDTPASQRSSMKWAAYRLLVKRLFCLELCLWLCAFIGFGLWVAALV